MVTINTNSPVVQATTTRLPERVQGEADAIVIRVLEAQKSRMAAIEELKLLTIGNTTPKISAEHIAPSLRQASSEAIAEYLSVCVAVGVKSQELFAAADKELSRLCGKKLWAATLGQLKVIQHNMQKGGYDDRDFHRCIDIVMKSKM